MGWLLAVLAAVFIGWEIAEAHRRRRRDKENALLSKTVRRMRGK